MALSRSCLEDRQLFQGVLTNVKRGETDANGDGAFDPVHRQAFIQSTDDPFRPKGRRAFVNILFESKRLNNISSYL